MTAGRLSMLHDGPTTAIKLAPIVPTTGCFPRAAQFTAISSNPDTTSET